MELFQKDKTFLLFHDKLVEIYTINKEDQIINHTLIDLPVGLVDNGWIIDQEHCHYLIQSELEEMELSLEEIHVIINSTDIVTRTIKAPSIEEDEIESLIENEKEEIFVQDMDEHMDSYMLFPTEEDYDVVISLAPIDLLIGYYNLFEELKIKEIYLYPLPAIYLSYLNYIGGGELIELGLDHEGFHQVQNNSIYSKTMRTENLSHMMEQEVLDYSSIVNTLYDIYDTRTADIDAERYKLEFTQALQTDYNYLINLKDSFNSLGPLYYAGSFFESNFLSFTKSVLPNKIDGEIISFQNLLIYLNNNIDVITQYQKPKEINRSKYRLTILGALVAIILAGSFFYGQYLEQNNRELEKQQKAIEQEQRAEGHFKTDNGKVKGIIPEEQKAFPEIINQVFLSKPSDVIITSINMENSTIEINGQTKNEAAVDPWLNELKKLLGKDIKKSQPSRIEDVYYFRFIIGEKGDNIV